MSNVLNEEERNQFIALGRLGWSLHRIEKTTGIRRETAGRYLKASGIAIRKPGWGSRASPDSKPAIEVTTDSDPAVSPKVQYTFGEMGIIQFGDQPVFA